MGRRGREVGLQVWLEDAGDHRVASGIKDQASLSQHGQPDAMHVAMHFTICQRSFENPPSSPVAGTERHHVEVAASGFVPFVLFGCSVSLRVLLLVSS